MKKQLLYSVFALLIVLVANRTEAQCPVSLTATTTSICQWDSAYIQTATTGQTSYEWFKNGVSVGFGSNVFSLGGLTPGTYTFTVEVTHTNSCVAMSNPIVITVNANPSISSVSNNGPLCLGSTLQLSVTATTGATFSWTGPGAFTSTQQNPSITNVQLVNSGNYSVVASLNGCVSGASTYASILSNNPAVVASADSNNSGGNFCVGENIHLQSMVSNITGASYTWTGPNSFSSTQSSPTIMNAILGHSGVYTLTVTGTGCGGIVTVSDTANVTVNSVPVVTASSNGPVCVGSTLQLTGAVSAGTYSWSGPNSFTSTSLSPSVPNAQTANTGTYTLSATNGNCSSQAQVYASILANNPTATAITSGSLCIYDTMFGNGASINVITAGMNNMTYSWVGPNSFASSNAYNSLIGGTSADAGTYTVSVTGNGCSGSVTLSSSVVVSGAACDSVWPGDANNSFDVNNWDFLAVGLAYGSTGPARTGASTNWTAQYCADWTGTFNNNQNYKFADCNGDGVVDGLDSVAIGLNYGQWHMKGEHIPQAKSSANADLFFDMTGIVFGAGSTVNIPIKLGTTSMNMQNIYGIATQVKISGVTLTTPMSINASGSWIGNSSNSLAFARSNGNSLDWAFTRSNHTNISGDGTIAVLTVHVPAGSEYQSIVLYFDNVLIVNKDGDVQTNYNEVDGGGLVFPLNTTTTSTFISSASIVPNPSDAHAALQVSLVQAGKVNVVVTDITGRNIWSAVQEGVAGTQDIMLPAAQLAPGMYQVQVRDDKGAVAQSLKWIKK